MSIDSAAPHLLDPLLELYDTGQPLFDNDQPQTMTEGEHLRIVQHEIHRTDTLADGGTESVMSTLKAFVLRVGLFDGDTHPATIEDGLQLQAKLIFETGQIVEDLSATCEPPLLGGEAIVEHGIASFKLRITVLSSLCRGNRFRVRITSPARSDLAVNTGPMRTLTKLRRGPALGKDKLSGHKEVTKELPGKRPCDDPLEIFCIDELSEYALASDDAFTFSGRTLDEIWEEVNSNASLLLELQKQQRALFRELRELRQKTE